MRHYAFVYGNFLDKLFLDTIYIFSSQRSPFYEGGEKWMKREEEDEENSKESQQHHHQIELAYFNVRLHKTILKVK